MKPKNDALQKAAFLKRSVSEFSGYPKSTSFGPLSTFNGLLKALISER